MRKDQGIAENALARTSNFLSSKLCSIIAVLQRLKTLNGTDISVEEKVAALNCHGADVERRKEACEKALGEGTFVDRGEKVDYKSLRDPATLGFERVKKGLMQFAVTL